MKTTFLPALTLLMGLLLTPQSTRASSPPARGPEGEALETTPATTLASAVLQPGPAKVAGRNVNVRSKPTLQSEVVTQLQDGEEVLVQEVILRPEAQGQDPARWAKIAYPPTASAWVHSLYVDASSSTIKARNLNVRSGPGENYTVIGSLRSGDAIVQLGSKDSWISIQPPKDATAYVAAKLLRQEAAAVTEVATTEMEMVETEVAATDTTMVETDTVVVAGTETGEPEMVAVETTETVVTEGATTVTDSNTTETDLNLEPLVATETLLTAEPEMEEQPEEPLPPRIVDREGIVQSFTSPHAPSHYKLVSADNGKLINYLYTTSTNLDLGRYVGLHIVASGEEALDERWLTPVLTLKRIVLVDYAQ